MELFGPCAWLACLRACNGGGVGIINHDCLPLTKKLCGRKKKERRDSRVMLSRVRKESITSERVFFFFFYKILFLCAAAAAASCCIFLLLSQTREPSLRVHLRMRDDVGFRIKYYRIRKCWTSSLPAAGIHVGLDYDGYMRLSSTVLFSCPHLSLGLSLQL
jgi:hypothetical protein